MDLYAMCSFYHIFCLFINSSYPALMPDLVGIYRKYGREQPKIDEREQLGKLSGVFCADGTVTPALLDQLQPQRGQHPPLRLNRSCVATSEFINIVEPQKTTSSKNPPPPD